ncbi:thrombospondin type 3 repeat-containing protein [uncultured Thalassolituus sp.]|uniref:thrombospondin type 3 repeat-containing protein n=1 Tax=uncultured Thalassolituus sp. TaxID=285273 RepID=UPI002629F237|nr:thrombospondin type 3 repeat-containing protein [uncultured Thalassolituus sp.]
MSRIINITLLLSLLSSPFAFSDTDSDGDLIWDMHDNCPDIANAEQQDYDSDGEGDACDNDIDNDGLTNEEEDNVGSDSYNSNDYTMDSDSDGFGNLFEAIAGTDPLSSESQPIIPGSYDIDLTQNPDDFPLGLQSGQLAETPNGIRLSLQRSATDEDEYLTGKLALATNFPEQTLVNIVAELDTPEGTAASTRIYTDGSGSGRFIQADSGEFVVASRISAGPRIVTLNYSAWTLSDDLAPTLVLKRVLTGQDTDDDYLLVPLDGCPLESSGLTDSDGDGLQDECDYDEADSDSDGVPDGGDNCPTVYNPFQEALTDQYYFFGDACNPDDDFDGIPDEIEDLLDYRDSRGGDLERHEYGFLIHIIDTDTDGDGANDVYEINTGTDPFTFDTFETISLTDYVPLGDIKYTYRAHVTISPPEYNTDYEETISEESPGVYKETAYGLFGGGPHYYRIGKDGIYLKGYDNWRNGDGYEEIDLLHLPFELQEGGSVPSSGASKCSDEGCRPHFIYMIDKGEMFFDGEYREYVTLVSSTFGFDLYYIYLKDIGLYGTHYMNLVDYEITNRVDVAAIAAALPEPETPVEVEPQPTSESSSSGGGGGAVNLFWMLLTMVSLIYRRKYRSA